LTVDDGADVLAAFAANVKKFSFFNELPLVNFDRLASFEKNKNTKVLIKSID
jgi:hypothetical protein